MLIRQLPRESATVRAVNGAAAEWGLAERLAAMAVHQLAGANWQRGGGKGPRPKLIGPPNENAQRQFGGAAIPLDEARDLFARWRAGDVD